MFLWYVFVMGFDLVLIVVVFVIKLCMFVKVGVMWSKG